MPALPQSGVTQADIFGHGGVDDMWDEIIVQPPEDEYEILTINPTGGNNE
jgi:hypothetical protein